MHPLAAIAVKDLRLLARDRAGFFFTLIFPVVFAVFFGMIFAGGGSGSGIAVAVVDEDRTPGSAAFIERLRSAPEFAVDTDIASAPIQFEQARDLVRRGRAAALVVLPKGFASGSSSPLLGSGPAIKLGVDPSRAAEAGLIEGALTRYAFERLTTIFSDAGSARSELDRARSALQTLGFFAPERRAAFENLFSSIDRVVETAPDAAAPDPQAPSADQPAAQGFSPVRIERVDVRRERRGPANSFAVTFAQGILWGVAGCAAAFGLSLVVERSRGTLVRLRTAPINWWQILVGKMLACFVATLAVGLLLLVIARVAFDVQPVAPALLALALLCVSFCFVGIMLLLAVIGRTESSAGSIGWAVILVMMMLGGGTIPIFLMPAWMQSLSSVSPVKWGILALEGGLWRDLSLAEMAKPCLILAAVGALGIAAGAALFRRTDAA
ncbi:MAG: ABC transporter permease [Planctomycetota bacterium]|nr:ABC transporter permease [Planctomycetota bacterium]